MIGLFELIRLGIYIAVIYKVSDTSYWVSGGFLLVFFLLELAFFLMVTLKKQLDSLSAVQTQKTSTDFGFSSEEITKDEADLVDAIRDGDVEASVKFLAGRCSNKVVDFNLIPSTLRLLLAQRLINAINRNETPTWEELLTKDAVEKPDYVKNTQ